MDISSLSAVPAVQSSLSVHRGDRQEHLETALKSIGVNDETVADVLTQVKDAVDKVKPGSSAGYGERLAENAAVAKVLQSHDIDPRQVGDALRSIRNRGNSRQSQYASQSQYDQRSGDARQTQYARGPDGQNRSEGPQRIWPPQGPPPNRHASESRGQGFGSVESALQAAEVDSSRLDDMLMQMVKSVTDLSLGDSSGVSDNDVQSALRYLMKKNGINPAPFDHALKQSGDSRGLFIDRTA